MPRAASKRKSSSEGAKEPKVKKMAAIERKALHTDEAPSAVGPYSQAVRVDRTLYISGSVSTIYKNRQYKRPKPIHPNRKSQIGFDPKTMKCVEGGVEAETHQVLKNMGAILENAGLDFSNVVKTTVLVQSMDDFAKVNAVYATYFKEPYPARACFEVARLPKGFVSKNYRKK